jgi:hypothetical protein
MFILRYICIFQSIKFILAITLINFMAKVYVSSLDRVAEERKYIFVFPLSVGRRLNSGSNFATSSFFYIFFNVWFTELLI